jgi:hypothetical protein
MNDNRKNPAAAGVKWLLALLFLGPALLSIGKLPALPTSELLWQWCSLAGVSASLADRIQYVLFVPLGALLVVFFRLALGIRVLGPFRSILIAVAFQITGILPGLLFLVAIIGIIVAVRPPLRALGLPYFARISVMLSAVSLVMVLAILSCGWLNLNIVERVAYFPIVVICLTAEGFARTLTKEGWGSALWRGGMTALVAVIITLVSMVPGVLRLLAERPELLLVQVGGIVVIARYFDWRLLERFNPAPQRRNASKKTRSARLATAEATKADTLDEAEEETQTW